MPAPKVAGTIRSKNPLKGAVEIIPERLYYAALKCAPPSHNILASTPKRTNLPPGMSKTNGQSSSSPAAAAATAASSSSSSKPQDPAAHDSTTPPKKEKKQIHFFNMDNELVYWNFFLDFGPLNLGQLVRFSNKLNDKLRKFPVVCFYSNTVPAKRANAIFLMCAWQILYLKRTPEQAHAGFLAAGANDPTSIECNRNNSHNKTPQSPIAPSSVNNNSTQPLKEGYSWPPVSDSQGAITVQPLPPWHDASPIACTYDLTVRDCLDGLVQALRHGFFDLESFNVEEYEHFEQVENGDLNWLAKGKILAFAGPSYERYVSPEGYCTLAPSDYIPYFKKRNVDLVVRLNKKNYNEEDFERAGIRHVEHFFLDGSCPSMKILKEVLDSFESVPQGKAFAVHCKAGLGRTGSCIGAYIMKHYRFTAPEVIAWMRMCRPGCVIGPQQHFLQQIQDRMWQAGEMERGQVPRKLPKSSTSPSSSGSSTPKKGRATKPDDDDAVTGRSGQGESLLAARGRRGKADMKQAIPGPPMTPESSKAPPAVLVTPGSTDTKTKAAPLWSS